MLSVDSIAKGVVIDHIMAGKSMDIYNYLKLGDLDCSVAIIKNVKSGKLGKKDIIKIEDCVDLDMDVLGYIDADITINIINDGVITSKQKLSLPEKLTNVIKCKNPRCITTAERDISHIFVLSERETHKYRCIYCEQEQK